MPLMMYEALKNAREQQQAEAQALQNQIQQQIQAHAQAQPAESHRGRKMGESEKLVTEFENLLSQRPWTSYGAQAQNQIKQKRETKKAPPEAKLKFAVFPAAELESFSPDELYDIATDAGFAKNILEAYSGREPTREQVSDLQGRVLKEFPELSGEIPVRHESMKDVMKAMINGLFEFRETGNAKPFTDLVLSYPGVAPELLEAAKGIKKAGYKEIPQNKNLFDAFRAASNEYARHPGGKQNLLERAESGTGFQGALAPLKRAMQGYVESPEDKRQREQDEAILKRIASQKTEKSERQKALPGRMKEARDVEKDVELLRDVSRRIAPLNEVHEQAKGLVNKGIGSDVLANARNKLAAAEAMDIPAEIAPYLQAANKPTREYIDQFMTDYEPVIRGFRQEAAKDFLEHDMPRINHQFASRGAFFSGAREAALNKARADKEARIEREVSKLLTHGHEQAMKHSHAHREGTLKSAEIAGNARKSQKEASHNVAEALRSNAQVEQGANLANVGALSNIARTQQQQAQHELDVRMAEHREQQERPFVELSRKHALMQGHQLPAFNFSPIGINPPPPSVYSLGANVLGHAAGMHKMGYSNEAPFKKGGHVRGRYAKGGPIARHAAEWQQIGSHMEGTPSARIADESMREAQAMRHHHINPQGAYLMALTGHQMANPGKPMMQTFGEGTQKAYNAFNSAKAYNIESKNKYINLINAIDKSRMESQSLLARYHLQKSQHEEAQRYHNMSHAESVRAHNMIQAHNRGNISGYAQNLPKFSSKEQEKAYYKREAELNKEHQQKTEATAEQKNSFGHVKKYVEEGIGPTGPFVGHLPDILATAFTGKESLANRRLFEKEINTQVVALTKKLKGTLSDARLNYLKRTIPTKLDDERTIEKYMVKWGKAVERAEEGIKFINEKIEDGLPIQEAKKEWEKYDRENPVFEEEDGSKEPDQESKSGRIHMIAPDGTDDWILPENVQTAKNMGAREAA